MSPRVVTRPTPPHEERTNPVPIRLYRDLLSIGIWKAAALHYSFLAALSLAGWVFTRGDTVPHPEIILKLAGAYCFLVGTLVVPLVMPLLLPSLGKSDPGIMALPFDASGSFDLRLKITAMLSAVALFPILPIFLLIGSMLGRPIDPYDVTNFFQGVLASCWVYILMDLVEGTGDDSSRMARRLALIVGFVFVHVMLVGLLAQTAFFVLQKYRLIKLLIDINPFSQLFILMEGINESRLIVNSDFQRFLDFRLYLFIINLLVIGLVWIIHRARLRDRPFDG